MSNVLSEEKRQQVIALGRLGWPLRRIQAETGVRRETAAAYLKAAGATVRPPGAWGRRSPARLADGATPDPGADAKAANEVTPDPAGGADPANEAAPDSGPLQAPGRSPSASACEPCLDFIEISLSKGRNAKAIYQDLADDHGFRGGYQSVKRLVRKLRGRPAVEACAIIVTPPGEEAQVDYGTGPMVRDPLSGCYRRTRMFALTLGYSRKAVHLLAFQSGTRIWAEFHEQAFRRLGGAARTVVLDFVPGNKIQLLWRAALCGGSRRERCRSGREAWMTEHNPYSESSHLIRSASFRHPPAGRYSAGRSTGGRHAATAACLVRNVISA
ncbi:MAG: transposase [Acidobacteria bacterium]|nr:transposase [Acidobacteriota bacterium]